MVREAKRLRGERRINVMLAFMLNKRTTSFSIRDFSGKQLHLGELFN